MKMLVSTCLVLMGVIAMTSTDISAQTTPTHEVCHNVQVQDKPADSHQIAGTAIGAAAGGLIGSKFGGGKGKALTTVGGVVAGGVAGKKIQENHQENNATYHYERRCYQVQG
jgi:uncharacterized protein YcfJ